MNSIRSRLFTGLGLIILFFLTQAVVVLTVGERTKNSVFDSIQKNTVASSQLSELAVLAQQIRRYEKEYFIYVGNKERSADYEKEWSNTAAKITNLLSSMQTTSEKVYSDVELSKVANWTAAINFYEAEMRKIFTKNKYVFATLDASKAIQLPTTLSVKKSSTTPVIAASSSVVAQPEMLTTTEANAMISEGKTKFSEVLIKGVAELSSDKTNKTLKLSQTTEQIVDKQFSIILLTTLFGLLVSIVLIFTLPKSITLPIQRLTVSVDNISKGNFDSVPTKNTFVEFEMLTKAIDRMQTAQKILVSRMRS
jgi:nitrogen fixation/metabolism regulation signal transduction histidine kinase